MGRRRSSRRPRLVSGAAALAVTFTVVGALLGTPLSALAASSPTPVTSGTKTPRPLAVSVPPEPVSIAPGETSKVHVRVVNPGDAPVTVTMIGRGLNFGDDGRVNVTSKPDPKWQGRVDFPAGDLTVPAQGFDDVFVTVRMPDRIDPDLYFIGFVVSPVKSGSGSVTLINQIGGFFTIDVPGPRVRKISARLRVPRFGLGPVHLSSVVVGNEIDGTLRVRNIGHAQVRFWGENDTTAWPGGKIPTQQRIEKSLLPVGRARSFEVVGEPAWPVGFVTLRVHIVYPGKTESATKEIVLTKRMLVISPWVIVAVCVPIALAMYWWLRRRRRRRPPARRRSVPQSSLPRAPSSRSGASTPSRRRTAPSRPGRVARPGRRRGIRRLIGSLRGCRSLVRGRNLREGRRTVALRVPRHRPVRADH